MLTLGVRGPWAKLKRVLLAYGLPSARRPSARASCAVSTCGLSKLVDSVCTLHPSRGSRWRSKICSACAAEWGVGYRGRAYRHGEARAG